jgi:hypothetical protein
VASPRSSSYESSGGSYQPVALYLWCALLLVAPLAIGAWFHVGASPRGIAIVTVLSMVTALVGGFIVGYGLHSARDVLRGAAIAGGAFSLGAFIIPMLIADATSPACSTLDCDLEPSASALFFFGIVSLIAFVIVGIGYRLSRWRERS